jgi:hypothetical protein
LSSWRRIFSVCSVFPACESRDFLWAEGVEGVEEAEMVDEG